MNFDIPALTSQIVAMTIQYAPTVILALLTLIIGFWLIGKISNILRRGLAMSGMDITFNKFLASIATIIMKVMLLLSVAGMFGVNTTSFVAILGALMVGVGMALNGSIGHAASGVMLMVFKPFKVGDNVKIGGGHVGRVEAINAFNTTLATADNKRIIIANSNVTDNTITNISGQDIVGVDLTFRIGYNDSIDIARQAILSVGSECPHILSDPAQAVVVAELGEISVNLSTRPFVKKENYWATKFYMNENIKKEFDKRGFNIPFPQMNLHQVSIN